MANNISDGSGLRLGWQHQLPPMPAKAPPTGRPGGSSDPVYARPAASATVSDYDDLRARVAATNPYNPVRNRWPDVRRRISPPDVEFMVKSLPKPDDMVYDISRVRDFRDLNLEFPKRRTSNTWQPAGVLADLIEKWGGNKFKWWHPPMDKSAEKHTEMEQHVWRLLEESLHPRDEFIRATWLERYEETHRLWMESLHNLPFEGRDVPDEVVLLPPCGWCGIPTGSWCEGTETEECMAPVCNACCDHFADACPTCCWWVGLPQCD